LDFWTTAIHHFSTAAKTPQRRTNTQLRRRSRQRRQFGSGQFRRLVLPFTSAIFVYVY